MSFETDYRSDGSGYLPWTHVEDDAKALRMLIAHLEKDFEMTPAWVVVATGDGQRLTAFSDEARAENFAGALRAKLPEAERFEFNPEPRVLVNRVNWPKGCKRATVTSWLNDGIAEDFLLCLPPVPVAMGECIPFRRWGIGGPDNVIDGYMSVLELDGATEEGGW
jgi:hypothetical protein